MPGKHVHFARTMTIHSPPIPALTSSSYSPDSPSASLHTPPFHDTGLSASSPYNAEFPSGVKKSGFTSLTRIHILLQPSHSPNLKFDLTQPSPSTVASSHRASHDMLAEPATIPPQTSMTILNPNLPWTITVHPAYGPYVTVEDVLEGMYRKLRMGVSSEEFYALGSGEDRERVTLAYEQRCRHLRSSREREDEQRRGVRRSDFLRGHSRFMGLSPTSKGPSVWSLKTT